MGSKRQATTYPRASVACSGPVRLMKRKKHNPQHFSFWSRLACPELELARALVDEHLVALDGWDVAGSGSLEQWRVQRVVDQVEYQARLPLVVFER